MLFEQLKCHICLTGQAFLFPGAHSAPGGDAAVSLGQGRFEWRAGHPWTARTWGAEIRAGSTSLGVIDLEAECVLCIFTTQ